MPISCGGPLPFCLRSYSNRYADEIVMIDAQDVFRHLGLAEHLTPQRSNGFAAMLERIRANARHAMSKRAKAA